jgi:hypothetical protein
MLYMERIKMSHMYVVCVLLNPISLLPDLTIFSH